MVPACERCNSAKSDGDYFLFVKFVHARLLTRINADKGATRSMFLNWCRNEEVRKERETVE